MNSAIAAATTFFIFTVCGYLAQVIKLWRRHQRAVCNELARDAVCDGLRPFREFVSYLAFLFFALSGSTRTYFDLMLVSTRLPVVILSTIVLGFLWRYGLPHARQFSLWAVGGIAVLLSTMCLRYLGVSLSNSILTHAVDIGLASISFLLLLGKLSQARHMWRSRRTAAVSWYRELGLVAKDLSGLWYALSVGPELFWIALTHSLSMGSSVAICVVKAVVERTSAPPAVE